MISHVFAVEHAQAAVVKREEYVIPELTRARLGLESSVEIYTTKSSAAVIEFNTYDFHQAKKED